ncbi:hypothetical protein ABTM76_19295, partial [Acinetobacter baumannii]
LVLYPIYFNRGNEWIPLGIAVLGALLFTVLHPRLQADPDDEEPPSAVGALPGRGAPEDG